MNREKIILTFFGFIAGIVVTYSCVIHFQKQSQILDKQIPINTTREINNFDDCVAAGYPVMESWPARCQTSDGKTFTQNIGNEMELWNIIRIESPRPSQTIESPLKISGLARGTWFFEADFPIKLFDADNNLISQGIGQAQTDWMTEDFVAFSAVIEFNTPQTPTGTLILQKNNPSGLPENDSQLIIPVQY